MASASSRLQVEQVSFSYGTDAPVLRDLSADFQAGSATAVTGPSGCGKSTLLYLLSLMVKPQSGTILLDGRPISHRSDYERSRIRAVSIGLVFQDAALDPVRSVLDNVLEPTNYHPTLSRSKARQRAVNLLERYGVTVPIDRRPGEISGGQAQRVGLCRALLTRPSLILADEPTGNLDGASADIVIDGLLEAAADGATVIVVTHSHEVAGRCAAKLSLPVQAAGG